MRYIDGVADGPAGGLGAWLESRFAEAEILAVRTGLFTMAGAEVLGGPVTRLLERGGRFHAVLGGAPEQTDPGALRVLADLVADFPDRASLHLVSARAGRQNAKTYYVRDAAGRASAYVGSADLTRGGLNADWEAGVLLDSEDDGAEALEAVLAGIRVWADHPHAVEATSAAVAMSARQVGKPHVGPAAPSRPLSETLGLALDQIEAIGGRGRGPVGVPSGFTDLDALVGGWRPGSLIVVGGHPTVGKSTLLLDFMRAAAIGHGLPAALFSLEASAAETNMRLLSAEARVVLHAMRAGLMNDDDRTRLARCSNEIAKAPLFLNDTRGLTISALRDEATRLVRDHDIRMIAVDHLQLVTPDPHSETREPEADEVIHALKALALDLKIPVIVAAQLNIGSEHTARRPLLSDLRESDAIARAADIIILLHREDAYERETPRAGEADLIVVKHRNGPTATLPVAFQGHYSRFIELRTPAEPEPPTTQKTPHEM